MIKKILLILILFGIFFQINVFAEDWWQASSDKWITHEEPEICWAGARDKINCSKFTINTENFSPGSKKILKKAQDGWWNTVESANAILWTIIKNLIVIFWALSLLMMTIGWWMMIFHAGQESILTRWKWIFVWWAASLAIWLSAGLIVKIVSYVLY